MYGLMFLKLAPGVPVRNSGGDSKNGMTGRSAAAAATRFVTTKTTRRVTKPAKRMIPRAFLAVKSC